ncbi:hypothetical protein WJX72_006304 [[Myrmecia] bisecta]|uniref:Uncharacterized protein n=1 Tax=[Myrmecia] bisecta TaxID=41462 RepID=A0AAW1PHE7_9CHLO
MCKASPELHVVADSRCTPRSFRAAGSPAGTFPHQPWWHCTFHDPYERVNVWSHGVPGLLFLVLGLLSSFGWGDGSKTLAVFSVCAACTHLLSAITHIFPDSHQLEKCDHLGIVALIIGTPVTALMAKEHGDVPVDLVVVTLVMLAAAFLPPLLRVLGFGVGIAAIVLLHGRTIVNLNLAGQLLLYFLGGVGFVRNSGHLRWTGFSDHHFLHYTVTAACCLHVHYILAAMRVA